MRRCLLLFYFLFGLHAQGSVPKVPSKMSFAGITLQITKAAKVQIQEKIDQLTRSKKHFQALLDRANLFLPIIERVLKEENLPKDFRFLVIQESALIADAVSSANAVGFWQFKEPAAREIGLKIDRHVDERMHITAATRAAARYLKKNNQEFNNWLYALLAYNEGREGAKKFIKKCYLGAKTMPIEQNAHVYIIHFLAYKVAFEPLLGKDRHPELYLHEHQEVHGKTLSEIAKEVGIDKNKIQDYNKWLKHHRVPQDTTCCAVVPMTHYQYAYHAASRKKGMPARYNMDYTKYWKNATAFPVITIRKNKKCSARVATINHIAGVVASERDHSGSLAQAGNISLKEFLMFNELSNGQKIIPGQVYYYRHKRKKARVHYHIVRTGETWWSIAQRYGITKEALLLKNRLRKEVNLQPGRILWLRFIRPASIPVAYEYLTNTSS
jgi:membrane-bound lytic murein transglycosylase D